MKSLTSDTVTDLNGFTYKGSIYFKDHEKLVMIVNEARDASGLLCGSHRYKNPLTIPLQDLKRKRAGS